MGRVSPDTDQLFRHDEVISLLLNKERAGEWERWKTVPFSKQMYLNITLRIHTCNTLLFLILDAAVPELQICA